MKTSLQANISDVQPAQATQFKNSAGAFMLAVSAVFIVVTAVPYLAANSSDDSVARRCDAQALATVGTSPADADATRNRHWRLQRKLAFERCVDASLLPLQQHVSP
jgi:hypothetical protein